jgi:hypothetical protein
MQALILPPRNPALCVPLTSNRDLGACLIANVPMRELLETELRRSGFQLVTADEACERTLRIPIDNWIELVAVRSESGSCEVVRCGWQYACVEGA